MNRYIFGIVGIAALIFALVTLNHGISSNAQPDGDDDQQSQQQNNQSNAKPAAKSATTPTAGQTADQNPPAEITVNDPSKAKYRIVAGWQFDSSNQSDPSKVSQSLQALQDAAKKSGGTVSVQAVDVDVPDDARSPATRGIHDVGITVNGKPLVDSNLGDNGVDPSAVSQAINTLPPAH